MSNQVELSVNSLGQLDQMLNRLVKSMNSLEDAIRKINTSKPVFERVFGSADEVRKLAEAINKIDSKSGTALSQIAYGLAKIIEQVDKIRDLPDNDKLFGTIAGGVESLVKLSGKITTTASFEIFAKTLVTLAQGISELATISKKLKQADLDSIYRNVFKLSSTFKVIGQFTSLVPGGNELGKLSLAIRALGTGLTALTEVSKNLSAGDITKLNTVVLRLASSFKIIAFVTENVPSETALDKLSSIFRNLGIGLASMAETVRRFSIGDIAKLTVLVGGLNIALRSVASLTKGSNKTQTDFSRFANAFQAIGSGLNAMRNLTQSLNVPAIIGFLLKVQIVVGILTKTLSNIANAAAASKGLDNLDKLAQIFDRLGRGLTALFRVIESIPPILKMVGFLFQLLKFFFVFNLVASQLASIANKLEKTKGLDNLDKLSFIFDRLGRGFRSIIVSSQYASFSAAFKLLKFIIGLGLVFRAASAITPNAAKLEGFAKASESLGLLLERFGRLKEGDISGGEKTLQFITKLVKQILPIFNTLKGFKNAKLPDIASILNSVGQFASLTKDVNFDPSKLQGFKQFTALLKDGIENLAKVKTNKAQLVAVADILKAIADLKTSPDVARDAQAAGTSISDEVKEGILKADFIKFVGSLLVDAFRNLNPVALARDFINAAGSIFTGVKDLVKNTIDSIRSAGDQLRQLGSDLLDFSGNVLSKVGLGALAGSEGFSLAADFEALSSQLTVFGGLNGDALKEAQEFANFIGIKYPLSTNDALGAILDLTKAGQDLADIKFILPSAADLTALSDSKDLERITQALIAAESGFTDFAEGVSGTFDNIDVAADLFAGFADISTASVDSLADGLANVGPAANAFGLSLADTLASLAIFDQNAVKGAESGTLLRSVLNTMGSARFQNGLQRLGVNFEELAYNADGTIKPLNDIMNGLREVVMFDRNGRQRSESEINQILNSISDTYGRQGLSILMNEGADAIKNVTDAAQGSGTAAEKAAKLMDNFKGDVEQLRGSFETLLTRAFLPILQNGFRPLVKIGRFVIDMLNGLSDGAINVIGNGILLASTAATIVAGFVGLVGIGLQVSGVFLSIVGSLAFLATSSVAIVGAVASVVAGLASLVLVGGAVIAVLGVVSAAFTTIINVFQTNAGGAGDALRGLLTLFQDIGTAIGDIFRAGGDIIGFILGDSLTSGNVALGQQISRIINGIYTRVAGFATKVKDVRDFATAFSDFLSLGDSDLYSNLIASFNEEGLFGSAAASAAEAEITKMRQSLLETLGALGQTDLVQAIFGHPLDGQRMLEVFESLRTNLMTLGSLVGDVVKNAGPGILDALGLLDHSRAEEELRSSISALGLFIAQQIQSLTGIDLSTAITAFEENDLTAAASAFIGSFVDSLRQWVLDNEQVITDVGVSILNFMVPGKFVDDLLRLMGLDELATTVQGVFDTITLIFEASFGTLFDLLQGKSLQDALIENFGPGIQPVIDAASEVASLLDNIVGLVGDVLAALFPSAPPAGEDVISSVAGGIEDVAAFLTDNIIIPLRQNLPPLIASVREFFGSIASFFSGEISFEEATTPLADGISGAINGAIAQVPDKITDIGVALGAPLIAAMGTALGTGDYTAVGTEIKNGINNAIAAVPGLITDLGTSIGSPIIANLGTAFSTGDFSTVGTAITDAITGILNDIPNRLQELGATLNLGFLTDFAISAEDSQAFQTFVDAIGRLVSFTIGQLGDIVTVVGEVVNFVLDLGSNPEAVDKLILIGAGIGAIVLASNGGAIISTVFSSLTTGLRSLLSFAGAIALFLVVKEGISAIVSVLSGEQTLGEAIGSFFSGIVESVNELIPIQEGITALANALGLQHLNGLSSEQFFNQVRTTWNQLMLIIQTIVETGLNAVSVGFQNTLDGIRTATDNIKFEAQYASPDEAARQASAAFFAVRDVFAQGDTAEFGRVINEAIFRGLDPETIKAQARINFGTLLGGFQEAAKDFPGLLADPNFTNQILGLSAGNALDEAIASLPSDMLTPFFQKLTEISPDAYQYLDFSQIASTIQLAVANNQIPIDLAQAFIYQLPEEVLTQSEKDLFITKLNEQFGTLPVTPKVVVDANAATAAVQDTAAQIEGAAGTTAVEVPITATPVVSVNEEAALAAQDAITAQITPTEAAPVEITTPADAQGYLDKLTEIQTKIDELSPKILLLNDDIALFSTAVTENLTIASIDVTLFETTANTSFGNVAASLQVIVDRLREVSATAFTNSIVLPPILLTTASFFSVFSTIAAAGLNPLIEKLQQVRNAINDIAQALGSLNSASVAPAGVGAGVGGNVPGRAGGGDVKANRLYEVAEGGIAELLRIGDRTYLIPGANGTVIPSAPYAGAFAGAGASSVTNNNSNVQAGIGTIVVNITGGTNLSVEEITRAIENGVTQDPLRRRLSVAGVI